MARKKKFPTMAEQVEVVHNRRLKDRAGGGEARLQKQRDAGKMTARERIRASMDDLLAELRQSADPAVKRDRPPTQQEALEWLAETKEARSPPPQMSDELRKILGLLLATDTTEAA